jgi:16S rRNA (cytosine967-C5)-methyltransferase
MTDVRLAAARVLVAIDAGETTLGGEVAHARDDLAPRDKALLVELTAGALRWRNELDAVIAAASQRSVRDIDPRALAVLRIGAYQIRHLDRIPPHAIVNTSVEAVRGLKAPKAAGFVNAVLRSLLRRGQAISLPARPSLEAHRDAQLAFLSVTLSHPRWLVSRWLDRMGFERTERWCVFNNTTPEVTVRSLGLLSPADVLAQLQAESVDAMPAPYVDDAVRLPPGALGRLSPLLRTELLVQDEGAQLVARMADAKPGESVLDVCASPGGKTVVMSADMKVGRAPGSRLIAADYRPGRMGLLSETLRHAGEPIPLVRLDARQPLPFHDVVDCVLLDAPCSGLGTVRRDPDVKWSRTPDDLPRLAAAELAMLEQAASVVKPGGRLVYATCSSEPEENAAVVDAFLAARPDFGRSTPASGARVPATMIDASGQLSTDPGRDGLEAFFAAVLVRRQGT